MQLRLYVTDAIWNWPINASNFCGIYMYILGLLCISCINNSCFYDSLTSDFFLFFCISARLQMALLSNVADVPEQMTGDKILTPSALIPGSPGLPGPQGQPF